MNIEPGYEYTCDLVVDLGLFGKHDVQTIIDVDSPTGFHGTGRLTGEPFKVLSFEINGDSVLVFENGVIEGNKLSFSVAEGGLSATFTTFLAEDGSITGTAEAAGILRMKLSGHVSSSTRL